MTDNMNRTLVTRNAALIVLAAVLTGCNISINSVSTGPLHTLRVVVPLAAYPSRPWDVELDPGAAMVTVDTGGDRLVSGTIDYNVDDWKPVVATSPQSVQITQGHFTGIPPANSQNDWNLTLGTRAPMSLTVNAGAIKGTWELGGLRLRSLDWHQGAADTTVRFSHPNPEKLAAASMDGGASSMKVEGLANANAQSVSIHIGAGSLMLRFDGTLARDVEVTLDGGAAAITIESGGNPVQVVVGKSLSAVSRGDWSQDGDTYQSPEWAQAKGPKVTVQARLGAASLNLVSAH